MENPANSSPANQNASSKSRMYQAVIDEDFKYNSSYNLAEEIRDKKVRWVNKNKATLIVHGIGNQLPLETLDSFARGIILQYQKADPIIRLSISHELVEKFYS